jgi:quercetin dioxygenase-like cupin family protein
MAVITVESGSSIPLHSHPHEQAGTVLEGEGTLRIGDEGETIRPGDFYVIPPNVEHEGHVNERMVVLDIFSPVRKDYKY